MSSSVVRIFVYIFIFPYSDITTLETYYTPSSPLEFLHRTDLTSELSGDESEKIEHIRLLPGLIVVCHGLTGPRQIRREQQWSGQLREVQGNEGKEDQGGWGRIGHTSAV